MPITKGAKKAHRASLHKRVYNVRRKKELSAVTKKITKLLLVGKKKDAQTILPSAYKAIDKAAKRGLFKKNTAARKKSSLSALIKKET